MTEKENYVILITVATLRAKIIETSPVLAIYQKGEEWEIFDEGRAIYSAIASAIKNGRKPYSQTIHLSVEFKEGQRNSRKQKIGRERR